MKRIVSILLVLTLVFALSACKKENGTSSESDTNTESVLSSIDTAAQNITNPNNEVENDSSLIATSSEKTMSSKPTIVSNPTTSSKPIVSSQPTASSKPSHIHSYSKATCTEPKKCSCGATDGQALGHKWIDATCKAPKTCSVCKITEGNSSNHVFSNGKCRICGIKDCINPINNLKKNIEYLTVWHINEENNDSLSTIVFRFEDDNKGYYGCYFFVKTNTEVPYYNYKGHRYGFEGSYGDSMEYTLTDEEVIVTNSESEIFRFVLNNSGDLKLIECPEGDWKYYFELSDTLSPITKKIS